MAAEPPPGDRPVPDQRPAGSPEADSAALAAQALARARADALARGGRPAGVAEGTFAQRKDRIASSAAGQQGRRERREDPAPLGAAIDGLVAETGWELSVATGSVFGRWAQIVGPDLAAHTAPERLTDGELVVTADSTAWATQLRLLAADLVRRLNAELGDGTVRRVNVRGPGAPSGRAGQWRVRGGRGPRDTYG
jgi:predicted nucleic acid-binding Zn ribbon protein